MTDYNLINKITAIRLELEYETDNNFKILIAIRNILNQTYEMTYTEIKKVLKIYYNLHHVDSINENIIDIITSENNINNSIILTLLNNFHNQTNNQINNQINNQTNNVSEDSLETLNSNSDSDDESLETLSSDNEILEESDDNMQLSYNNLNTVSNTLFSPEISSWQTQNYLFYGPNNNQFNNTNIDYSNIFNTLFSLSSDLDLNLNNLNNINNNNNFFINSFLNINQQNENNDDIPIVITESSFSKLKMYKYSDIDNNIKQNNIKCMITLEDFKDDNIVLLLPCNHIFSYDEIRDWLKNNSYKCPSCRNPAGEYYAKIN